MSVRTVTYSLAPAHSVVAKSITDQAQALEALRAAFTYRVGSGAISDLKTAAVFIDTWVDAAAELAASLQQGGEKDG